MNKNKNKNTNINNRGLVDKIYEEISFTCTEINSSYEANYADSTLNFFGVSSGIRYLHPGHTLNQALLQVFFCRIHPVHQVPS